MIEVILFAVTTAALLYVSHASLRVPGSHGFYRFFAWECLAALLLLNGRYWFDGPFSPHQIVSWLLLSISLVMVWQGIASLRHRGNPDPARDDVLLIGFEKTTVLVTEGVYHYIRHPIYSSLLFLGFGLFFKHPSWVSTLLVLGAGAFLILAARAEEGENLRYFGEAYREYMKHSMMFIPFVL